MTVQVNYRRRAILIIAATIIGMCAIGVFVVSSVIGGISAAAKGRTYSDTLSDAQQTFGDDAKVVKVNVDGGGVDYDVLSPDASMVLMRTYTVATERTTDPNTGAPATGYNNHTDERQRAATPADVKGATITLGQLNKDVVEQLWDDAGFPHSGSTATLQGTTWTIGSGAHPFDKYEANFDGSGFHQTQSQSDVFGNGTTTTAPAPKAAPPGVSRAAVKQAQAIALKRARAIADCMRRAQGDVSKVQACVGQ